MTSRWMLALRLVSSATAMGRSPGGSCGGAAPLPGGGSAGSGAAGSSRSTWNQVIALAGAAVTRGNENTYGVEKVRRRGGGALAVSLSTGLKGRHRPDGRA